MLLRQVFVRLFMLRKLRGVCLMVFGFIAASVIAIQLWAMKFGDSLDLKERGGTLQGLHSGHINRFKWKNEGVLVPRSSGRQPERALSVDHVHMDHRRLNQPKQHDLVQSNVDDVVLDRDRFNVSSFGANEPSVRDEIDVFNLDRYSVEENKKKDSLLINSDWHLDSFKQTAASLVVDIVNVAETLRPANNADSVMSPSGVESNGNLVQALPLQIPSYSTKSESFMGSNLGVEKVFVGQAGPDTTKEPEKTFKRAGRRKRRKSKLRYAPAYNRSAESSQASLRNEQNSLNRADHGVKDLSFQVQIPRNEANDDIQDLADSNAVQQISFLPFRAEGRLVIQNDTGSIDSGIANVNVIQDKFAAEGSPVEFAPLPTRSLDTNVDNFNIEVKSSDINNGVAYQTNHSIRVGGINVVSMSLYGSLPRYTAGALKNAKLIRRNFPGWSLRIYTESPALSPHYDVVPSDIIESLRRLGADIQYIIPEQDFIPPMMWRFLVADDISVDRFIVRDTDSRLTRRDAAAVNAWIHSGMPFHSIRDHPSHAAYAISGGLWGGKTVELRDILRQSWMNLMRGMSTEYLRDMTFLNDVVWPRVKHKAFCSDSVSCDRWPNSFPFPVKRHGFEHVGQVYNEEETGRPDDISILRRAGENPVCLP